MAPEPLRLQTICRVLLPLAVFIRQCKLGQQTRCLDLFDDDIPEENPFEDHVVLSYGRSFTRLASAACQREDGLLRATYKLPA